MIFPYDTGHRVKNYIMIRNEVLNGKKTTQASHGPIKLVKDGRVKALQSLRYTSLKRIQSAKTLDDVF